MYARSNAAPLIDFSSLRIESCPAVMPRLVSLSSGVRLSFPASALALLLTEVWSVIICCAKAVTSGFLVLALASLPLRMSALFAATTIAAMFASLSVAIAGAGACVLCSDIVPVDVFDMSDIDDDFLLEHD